MQTMKSNNNKSNDDSFQPTVDSLEQALSITVQRNIELQTMLQNRKSWNSDSRLRVIKQLIQSTQKLLKQEAVIDSSFPSSVSFANNDTPDQVMDRSFPSSVSLASRDISKFISDFHELLLEFLREVEHRPQDRTENHRIPGCLDDNYIQRRDVTWFVHELLMRFNQLTDLYYSERRTIQTWTNKVIDSINNIEKCISAEQNMVDCEFPHQDLECEHPSLELKENEVYISSLEDSIVCLQDDLSHRNSKRSYEIGLLPQSPTDELPQQILFNNIKRELVKKEEELVNLREQNARILEEKRISNREQKLREEATKTQLIYLHQIVRDLERKILKEQFSASSCSPLESSLQNPLKGHDDINKSIIGQESLLSPNPKFFSFTKLSSTTRKDI